MSDIQDIALKHAADVPAMSTVGAKPRRVLQLVHSNEAGGVEALAGLISAGLTARGHIVETHFLYPAFAVGSAVKAKGMVATILHVLRQRPDALIAYQSTASVLAGVLGRLAGCRTRIIHQTAVPEAVHPLVRALDKVAGTLGFYSINIANSAATEAAFADYPVRYRDTMLRIEHGIDPPQPASAASAVRARYGIDPDVPLLVSTGRLSDQKALDRAIRALPLIPDAHLALAGGGPNEAQLRSLAKNLGVADRVHFLGYLSRQHVADLLGAADVFVFPTVWETFGLAPVEAAMTGVPVVASDLPVLREVLSIEGATPARFVDSADAEALAIAVRDVLGDGGARAMAKSFAPRLAAKYSMQRMLDRYAELIAE